jgi:hypothetical protein
LAADARQPNRFLARRRAHGQERLFNPSTTGQPRDAWCALHLFLDGLIQMFVHTDPGCFASIDRRDDPARFLPEDRLIFGGDRYLDQRLLEPSLVVHPPSMVYFRKEKGKQARRERKWRYDCEN